MSSSTKEASPFKEFTSVTKKVCLVSAIVIASILLFCLSPLRYFRVLSIFMRGCILVLLVYLLFLGYMQAKVLQASSSSMKSGEAINQLQRNLYCTYFFILLVFLLFLLIVKSMFA